MSNNNQEFFTICEYGKIFLSEKFAQNSINEIFVNKTAYKELEDFAKTEKGSEVFGFSKNGKSLQAKNYVGVIKTNSGLLLEILPKIAKNNEQKEDVENLKAIFEELLKILYKLPNYKHIDKAKLSTQRKSILEIYISMFLDEVSAIIKKGLKSDYVNKEENLYFLKGKLKVKEQIAKNFIHKERFFVEYDEYSQNRAENRLIKTTLLKLLNLSKSYENTKRARQYIEHMSLVDKSLNIQKDFSTCKTNVRGMEHYKNALIWAKVFLCNETFTTFKGETIAFALLYPMEKLFECFVEWWLKNKSEFKNHVIYSQLSHKKDFLTHESDKILGKPRPDFIIKQDEKFLHIVDAKWKLIEEIGHFSQNDFYQMFVYHEMFSSEIENEKNSILMFYPKTEYLTSEKYFKFYHDGKIKIIPLDLKEILIGKN
ncbi:MAG: 5-methylcytosine restriction system specificity protein McrC [Campylobacteraceae bacterium]